jgi:hypothetical protein
MIKIDDFAFCFFSTEIENIIEQEKEITKLSDKFQIERWYRHDRNSGRYPSFSQMVNDAIDDTDSEFMIFCNPKTTFKSEDIEIILDKLSNGYCFVSLVSFGFFGFSKELIRRIGMLDERFINGEFEDDDFAIRLKYFGKAAWWEYDYDKYDAPFSKSGNLKHITLSIFKQKYEIQDSTILINKQLFTHKRISKRHRKQKQYIYDSWLDYNHNGGNGKISEYLTKYDVKLFDPNKKELNTKFSVNINRTNLNDFKVEVLSNKNIVVFIAFLTNIDDNRKVLYTDKIQSNFWKDIKIFYDKEVEIRLFVDDNQIYNTIMEEEDSLNLNFYLPLLVTE